MSSNKIVIVLNLITLIALAFTAHFQGITLENQKKILAIYGNQNAEERLATEDTDPRRVIMAQPCEKGWEEAGQQCPKPVHAFFACGDINRMRDWDGFVVVHGDTCDCAKFISNSHHFEAGTIAPGESKILRIGNDQNE